MNGVAGAYYDPPSITPTSVEVCDAFFDPRHTYRCGALFVSTCGTDLQHNIGSDVALNVTRASTRIMHQETRQIDVLVHRDDFFFSQSEVERYLHWLRGGLEALSDMNTILWHDPDNSTEPKS